ncbi:hypothetical protein PFDSM3638_01335 [Pyrococcus furiosus DSM 3638]|uniref:Uncharacterized protein n=3 Tax=Pyrococcus furiosus TaxID=2261 RepID=Q8U416_PYRFU|nr:hypothetical protein [Pyrococcus furiosus]AAL80405.1 hypothetical protein PF0281 [Pyrococcus furiosus DSM 3638]AFN03068.1 hypothetical protein PFC_00470 [Pyrococcus furiosus COM1]QEK77998.1 hypothetical protein PFDSM3638_01335 [Pyrococcus furiosus DSM 3638]
MPGPGILLAGLGIIGAIVLLIALFIAGLFLHLGAKLVGIKEATLGKSIVAILGGGILAVIVTAITGAIPVFGILAPIFGFITYLWVIKAVFNTGWLRAFLALVLAVIIEFIVAIILGIVFGISLLALL